MTDGKLPLTASARFGLPFLAGDLLLLGAAWLIYHQGHRPMLNYEVGALALSVALGAWLGALPFLLRHRAELKTLETDAIKESLAQLQNIQEIAQRIGQATGQWQTAQEHAVKTVHAAQEISERMTAESKDFMVFLEKANETERAHLRLEVEKLRRAEGDWLQLLVRVMDHVYALYMAGVHSGQTHLIEQLGAFQNACRDAIRRVGLVPLVTPPNAPFDGNLHQLPDPNAAVPPEARVAETLAPGYSFQGQLMRRALVLLQPPSSAATEPPSGPVEAALAPPASPAPSPEQLPLVGGS